eukprot:3754809-Prymnesium_polylepis.1
MNLVHAVPRPFKYALSKRDCWSHYTAYGAKRSSAQKPDYTVGWQRDTQRVSACAIRRARPSRARRFRDGFARDRDAQGSFSARTKAHIGSRTAHTDICGR